MSNPVYLIAQIDVKDYGSYLTDYGFPLLEQLDQKVMQLKNLGFGFSQEPRYEPW
jgi:hypothetical protein